MPQFLTELFWLLTAALAVDLAWVCAILWRRYPSEVDELDDVDEDVSLWAEANYR